MHILNWIKKIRIQKETFFDIKLEDETIYHPNIQGVRSTKAVIDYILKHADYISKYKIDNLQIAQIIIEKEIKEGRYITNNKLAKEYFKTYTLYNKRLIDWKTKIKEQYYKSLGKPFVEFHYGDKMCRKSSYAEILMKRLHIGLITKIAKRNKNNQLDSETSSINSQDSENAKRYKQKKSKIPKLIEDIWKKIA
ncbi:hypothetical protein C2G38_2280040 [Gigaspora rosea]|uniref:CRESS-DNA virus Rep endonuclease domain-containing protein n=1 Tax=Gigaspora rosea TaxID=44941 RepID=A0A397UES7_9GLOM|nr:hypothetical protein C2G38_2280040 [Gigaspora rosea]